MTETEEVVDKTQSSVEKTKPKSLLRSTSTISLMTLLSRILGFARDMVIAHIFGAGAEVDAFFVAFKIPNFMRRLFAEGAFSQAFVPLLGEYRDTKELPEIQTFVNHAAGSLAVVLLGVTVLAIVCAPIFVAIFAPGFIRHEMRFTLAREMLQITFPYLFFISLTAFCSAILNCYRKFAAPAFNPILLNICLILAAVLFGHWIAVPVKALAWGVFAAGIVQLLFLLPHLAKLKLFPRFKPNFRDPGVKRLLKLMVPAVFGVSVSQINLLLDTLFASFLPAGSVSWLYYSERLSSFPLGVFGVAIATVILPHLSGKNSQQTEGNYSATIDWATRLILLIGLPAAVGLLLLAGPLLTTLFQYGKFHDHDVVMSSYSLMAFAIGVPAFMLIKVFASGFYARQDIKTPVKIGIIAMVANMVMNVLLIKPLAHAGLALSTSLAAFINAGCLFYYLLKKCGFKARAGFGIFALRLLIANVFLAATLWFANPPLVDWFHWSWAVRFTHLFVIVPIGMMVYSATLWILGLRVRDLRKTT